MHIVILHNLIILYNVCFKILINIIIKLRLNLIYDIIIPILIYNLSLTVIGTQFIEN